MYTVEKAKEMMCIKHLKKDVKDNDCEKLEKCTPDLCKDWI